MQSIVKQSYSISKFSHITDYLIVIVLLKYKKITGVSWVKAVGEKDHPTDSRSSWGDKATEVFPI